MHIALIPHHRWSPSATPPVRDVLAAITPASAAEAYSCEAAELVRGWGGWVHIWCGAVAHGTSPPYMQCQCCGSGSTLMHGCGLHPILC